MLLCNVIEFTCSSKSCCCRLLSCYLHNFKIVFLSYVPLICCCVMSCIMLGQSLIPWRVVCPNSNAITNSGTYLLFFIPNTVIICIYKPMHKSMCACECLLCRSFNFMHSNLANITTFYLFIARSRRNRRWRSMMWKMKQLSMTWKRKQRSMKLRGMRIQWVS